MGGQQQLYPMANEGQPYGTIHGEDEDVEQLIQFFIPEARGKAQGRSTALQTPLTHLMRTHAMAQRLACGS